MKGKDIDTVVNGAPKLTKELCRIKWENNVSEIHNLIRGLSPYPAAFSTITDGSKEIDMKIYEALPVESSCNCANHGAVGKIVTDRKSFIHVICANGRLSLEEIQLAGKKRMKVKDFLLGFRDIENFRFI